MAQRDDVSDATRYLTQQLEQTMYGRDPRSNLLKLLTKLDIKNAKGFGTSLQVEGLDAVLKQVTFDMNSFKLWK